MKALSEHGSIADVCNPGTMGTQATTVVNRFMNSVRTDDLSRLLLFI